MYGGSLQLNFYSTMDYILYTIAPLNTKICIPNKAGAVAVRVTLEFLYIVERIS